MICKYFTTTKNSDFQDITFNFSKQLCICLQPYAWLESYGCHPSCGTKISGSIIVSQVIWLLLSHKTLSVSQFICVLPYLIHTLKTSQASINPYSLSVVQSCSEPWADLSDSLNPGHPQFPNPGYNPIPWQPPGHSHYALRPNSPIPGCSPLPWQPWGPLLDVFEHLGHQLLW